MMKKTMARPENYGKLIVGISRHHVYSAMISRDMQLGLIRRAE
jgi:pyruvate-formate lyase